MKIKKLRTLTEIQEHTADIIENLIDKARELESELGYNCDGDDICCKKLYDKYDLSNIMDYESKAALNRFIVKFNNDYAELTQGLKESMDERVLGYQELLDELSEQLCDDCGECSDKFCNHCYEQPNSKHL